MKITRNKLLAIIKEELAHIVLDDVHEVPDDLEALDPYEAYGLGHAAGMEHAEEEESYDLEEVSFLADGKKASKSKGKPYKGSRRGKTESQAQQMSAGIALGSRRKYGKKGAIKKLKGAPKSMATMSMKDLKKLATIRRGSEVPDKTKKGHERAALPGHIDESIKVRGIPVNWDKTIDGDPAISFGSNLYTVTGPMGVSIDIKNIEYSSDPESAELVASADLPWPAQDKIITDMLKPKNIDAIVSGVNSGGDFEIVGRHGAVKFNRVKG